METDRIGRVLSLLPVDRGQAAALKDPVPLAKTSVCHLFGRWGSHFGQRVRGVCARGALGWSVYSADVALDGALAGRAARESDKSWNPDRKEW
jgi:hypothetical protein